MSEVAGRLAVQSALCIWKPTTEGAAFCWAEVPGVAPGNVVIWAAESWEPTRQGRRRHGAHVTLIDRNINRLRQIDDVFHGHVVTLASNVWTVREALRHRGSGDRRSAGPRGLDAQDRAPRHAAAD